MNPQTATFKLPVDVAFGTIVITEETNKPITILKVTVNEKEVPYMAHGKNISILNPIKKGEEIKISYNVEEK